MITINTSRLLVRPFTAADIDAVEAIHNDCFGQTPRDQVRAWLDWTLRNYAALEQLHQPPYGDYAAVLKDLDTVIGSVGLVPSLGPFGKLAWFKARQPSTSHLFTPEVGLFWGLRSGYRGRGYASEAAGALAAFAFRALQLERLVATTEHANVASIAVMRRLGMLIDRNPDAEPHWFQTVGVLENPRAFHDQKSAKAR